MFKVAIVGKANVGKSTLFNKIAKQKRAIALDRKGVTRDVLDEVVVFKGKKFLLLDTAGFNPKLGETIDRTEYSIKNAEIIFFVIENTIDQEDQFFASWLRRNAGSKEIILLRNKSDCKNQEDCSVFGFKKVFYVSAEHSIGIREVLSYVASKVPQNLDEVEEKKSKNIRLAIFGQPNVGKSTLMNRILNDNRSLISDQAGTTRDPVSCAFIHNQVNFNLIDTAGLRKKAKVIDQLETMSNSKSMQIIKIIDIALFLFDISNFALEKQDFLIINKILESGKPTILIANKIDKVENREQIVEFVQLQANKFLIDKIKIFPISSLHDSDFSNIVHECNRLFIESRRHISTHKLNNWLVEAKSSHKHPIVKGKEVKFKYIIKLKDCFVFIVHCTNPDLVDISYMQYLKNSLAKTFKIEGIPIIIKLKKSESQKFY